MNAKTVTYVRTVESSRYLPPDICLVESSVKCMFGTLRQPSICDFDKLLVSEYVRRGHILPQVSPVNPKFHDVPLEKASEIVAALYPELLPLIGWYSGTPNAACESVRWCPEDSTFIIKFSH